MTEIQTKGTKKKKEQNRTEPKGVIRVERGISKHMISACAQQRYDGKKEQEKYETSEENVTNGARSCALSRAMDKWESYCLSRSDARTAPRCAVVRVGGDCGRWALECGGPVGLRTLIFGGVCVGCCCCRWGGDEGDGRPLGLGERYGGGSAGAR